jgi:hypothetical protein
MVYFTMLSVSQNVECCHDDAGMHKTQVQGHQADRSCMIVPKACRSSVGSLLHVTLKFSHGMQIFKNLWTTGVTDE